MVKWKTITHEVNAIEYRESLIGRLASRLIKQERKLEKEVGGSGTERLAGAVEELIEVIKIIKRYEKLRRVPDAAE